MKTAKKGFTLIELMVVIVIIGILAAIAIPKLFGMTAKAKASEVGPAAGTWNKLEQAYYLETSKFGSFQEIGYSEPQSNNFTYTDKSNISLGNWEATNSESLGECSKGNKWTLTLNSGFTATASAGDCGWLTPNFAESFTIAGSSSSSASGASSTSTPSSASDS